MASSTTFVMYTTAGKFEVLPAAAKTILGEYVADGTNHDRPMYRKKREGGAQRGPEVLLFYWDERDGKELSGWWFGDQIGAGQVWARSGKTTSTPPEGGWRTPVDGPVRRHMHCTAKTSKKGQDMEVDPDAKEDVAQQPRKRASDDAQAAPAAKKANRQPAATPQALTMTSNGGDASIKKLLGNYVPQDGLSHGKPTYIKEGTSGEDAIWLYYWDQRDGWDFSGWWLGSRVGGALVYARVAQHSATPPKSGWQVPHDGAVRSDMQLKPRPYEEDGQMTDEQRLMKTNELVKGLEEKTDKAIVTASTILDADEALEEGVRAAFAMMSARITALEDAKLALGRHAKAAKKQKASAEAEGELSLLEERVVLAVGKATPLFEKARERLEKVDDALAEERDGRAVAAALPTAMELTVQVEMASEAATSAVNAEKARVLLGKATSKISGVLKAAAKYAPEAKDIALKEFGELQERCDDVRARLSVWGKVPVKASRHGAPADSGVADEQWEKGLGGADDGSEDEDEEVEVEEDDEFGVENITKPDERLQQFVTKVKEAEVAAKQALETADVVLVAGASSEKAEPCLGLLRDKRKASIRLDKCIARDLVGPASRRAAGPVLEALRALGPRLRAVTGRLEDSLGKWKHEATNVKRQARQDLRQHHGGPDVTGEGAVEEAVDRAEEAVEKVAIGASDIEMRRAKIEEGLELDDEESREVRNAMDQTQASADRAQGAIAAARGKIDMLIRKARGLQGDEQKAAFADIAPLRSRLVASQKRLNPYKQVRQDFDKHAKALKGLEAVTGKMVCVEEAIVRIAGMLAAPGPGSEQEVKAVEMLVTSTQKSFVEATKLLALPKTAGGALEQQAVGLKRRSQAAKHRLDELRAETRDTRGGLLARVVLVRAREEAAVVDPLLPSIDEVEKPWKHGKEVLPEAEATPLLQKAGQVTAEAEPVAKAAKAALMHQLQEINALPEVTPKRLEAAEEVQALIAKVEHVLLKVTQLKVDTFARKTKMAFPDAVQSVAAAESKVASAVTAAAPLSEDNLATVSAEELKGACSKVTGPADAAAKLCAKARAAVEERQKDPKFWSSPSFCTQLTKLANRVDAAESTITNLRDAAKTAEKYRAKGLQDQRTSLAAIEKRIAEVELLSLPLGDERPTEAGEESTAKAVQDVQDQLTAWLRSAEDVSGQRQPYVSMRKAMERVLGDAAKLQTKLNDVKEMTREQRERALCRIYVKDGVAKLKEAEEAVAKAAKAEEPLLKGVDTMKKDLAAKTLAQCEAASAAAKEVLEKTRDYFAVRCTEVISFVVNDAASALQVHELKELQRRATVAEEKLLSQRSDLERYRRKVGTSSGDEPPQKKSKKN